MQSAKDFKDLPGSFEIYAAVNLDILSIIDTTDFITGKEITAQLLRKRAEGAGAYWVSAP